MNPRPPGGAHAPTISERIVAVGLPRLASSGTGSSATQKVAVPVAAGEKHDHTREAATDKEQTVSAAGLA